MTIKNTPHISVVTPVYGCVAALSELAHRLHVVLGNITPDYEIIMVNDASPDESWTVIKALAAEDARVKGINLSRNFGQHYAITAGLDYAMGDWVVVMDCDLQDIPEEIIKLYEFAQSGYDIVVGRRVERQDSWIRKQLSRAFYQVFRYFTGTTVDPSIGNFGIYSKTAIINIQKLREQNRSFGLFALWVGFRRIEIDVQHAARTHGKSSYSLGKMFGLAIDSIVAHSNKVLHLTVRLGFTVSLLAFIYAGWMFVRYYLWGIQIVGWTSVIVSIYMTAGMIVGALGVVGLYVGKIFNEVKHRPLYVIQESTFEVMRHDK